MIVKCKTDKAECPMIKDCLARLNDPTVTGCGIPLWYIGVIRKEEIMVEHEEADEAFIEFVDGLKEIFAEGLGQKHE